MARSVHDKMFEAVADEREPLRVLLRHGMVTDFGAMRAGLRKFVGLAMCHDRDDQGKPAGDHGKFLFTDLIENLPVWGKISNEQPAGFLPEKHEYFKAIREGHLVATDESTARRAAAGYSADWKSLMATPEELKVAEATASALEAVTASNTASAKKVALAPANPLPDPSKLVPKIDSTVKAPSTPPVVEKP